MMMTTNTKPSSSHSNCAHDATKAARALCRKARNMTNDKPIPQGHIIANHRLFVEAGVPLNAKPQKADEHDCSQYPLDDNDCCTACGREI